MTNTRHRLLVGIAIASLALGACGDDGPEAAGGPDQTLTVTTVDYGYQDLPTTIAAGTTLEVSNASDGEVHELLAFRVADGEERSVAELIEAVPPAMFEPLELRGVALAPPGASSTAAPTPPLVLEQPGTYAFICILPTDGPPDEVMAAVAAFVERGAPEGETPDYPETGPPHFMNGMWAEVTVVA